MLEDEGQLPVRVEDVVEADDIAVLQLLEQANLAESGGRNALKNAN